MADDSQLPISAEEQLAELIKNSKNPYLDPWSVMGIHKINLEIFNAIASAGLQASNSLAKLHLATMQSDLKQSSTIANAGKAEKSLEQAVKARRDALGKAVQARHADQAKIAKEAEALNLQAVTNLEAVRGHMANWYDSISKPPPRAGGTPKKRK
jgi:hypothetical protein